MGWQTSVSWLGTGSRPACAEIMELSSRVQPSSLGDHSERVGVQLA